MKERPWTSDRNGTKGSLGWPFSSIALWPAIVVANCVTTERLLGGNFTLGADMKSGVVTEEIVWIL